MQDHEKFLQLRESDANRGLNEILLALREASEDVQDWLCDHGTNCLFDNGEPCVFCRHPDGSPAVDDFQEALQVLNWTMTQTASIIATNMPGVPQGPPQTPEEALNPDDPIVQRMRGELPPKGEESL